jgi:hypothetical protein
MAPPDEKMIRIRARASAVPSETFSQSLSEPAGADATKGSEGFPPKQLLARTIFPSRIGDAGDNPLSIGVDEVEQVGATVVYFSID